MNMMKLGSLAAVMAMTAVEAVVRSLQGSRSPTGFPDAVAGEPARMVSPYDRLRPHTGAPSHSYPSPPSTPTQQVDTAAEIETRDLGSADHDPWADDGHGDSWSAPTDDWGGDDYHYGGKGGKSGSGGSDDDGHGSWSAPTDDWGGDDYHYGGKGGKSGSGGSDDDGWSGGDSHYHGHWVSFHPSRP